MSKRLILVRHAKSSWDNPSLHDHERPLNKRGSRDAVTMGKRLAAKKVRPNLIITSDAERAAVTARMIAKSLGYTSDSIVEDPDLYLASAKRMLEVLSARCNAYDEIMLIAHNPGITELANRIGNERIQNLPTSGIYAVEGDIDNWLELHDQPGTTLWFDYPKNQAAQ